jgi:hypothetical protein
MLVIDMINVERNSDEEFIVTVEERGSRTRHTVTLDDEYYEELTHGKITKEELIERSFEFLLKRESKESILSRFNLKVINRYFTEYEYKIKIT